MSVGVDVLRRRPQKAPNAASVVFAVAAAATVVVVVAAVVVVAVVLHRLYVALLRPNPSVSRFWLWIPFVDLALSPESSIAVFAAVVEVVYAVVAVVQVVFDVAVFPVVVAIVVVVFDTLASSLSFDVPLAALWFAFLSFR